MHFHIVFILMLISCSGQATAKLSDEVINLLEEFRIRMCHPFPQWNLPALDPFEIAYEEIYIDNSLFKNFSGSVTNFKATGLSNFIINEVQIKPISRKFKMNLTFPLYEVQSNYKAIGSLGSVVNLVGDDKMNGHLKDVNIVINGDLKFGLTFALKNVQIKFAIGNLFVDFGKLMEHDRINNFIHNLLNDLTIELLGDFWEDYGEPLTKKFEKIINNKMSKFTLKEVIGIISGSGQPVFGDNPPGDCKISNHVIYKTK